MDRQSFITYSKVQTNVDDLAFLRLLSLGRAYKQGKTHILSVEKRGGCRQVNSKGAFHIRTSARMGETIESCELHLLPLEVSGGKLGDMGRPSRRRPNTLSYCLRDILGRNGFPARSGRCLYGSFTDGKTWWAVYWRFFSESRVFPLSCGE